MNILGLRCSVDGGRGKIICVLSCGESGWHRFTFLSPSVFSFSKNSGEILNWHRDNVLSLTRQFNVDAIVIKKQETESIVRRPKKSDIFKLYLEGVLLSFAGGFGMPNQHYYKNDIKAILGKPDRFGLRLEEVIQNLDTAGFDGVPAKEKELTKELVLAVTAYKETIQS